MCAPEQLWRAPLERILAYTADVGLDVVFEFGCVDRDDVFDGMNAALINVLKRNQTIPIVNTLLPGRIIAKSAVTTRVTGTNDIADVVCIRPVFLPPAPFGIGPQIGFVHEKSQRVDRIDVVGDTFVDPDLPRALRRRVVESEDLINAGGGYRWRTADAGVARRRESWIAGQ